MVLTGPEGSEAFCYRVARTVELGAEDDSDGGHEQGNGSDEGGGQDFDNDDEQDDESSASSPTPHIACLRLAL